MTCSDIPINLVFEDALSGSILRRIVAQSQQKYQVGIFYDARGWGRIKNKINGLNNAAKGMPYLVLTDLDRYECPPVLIKDWFNSDIHTNLLFRVAVREVEAWVLACRDTFAKYLGVRENLIPSDVDSIEDAKQFLINLARRSRKRKIRLDIVPAQGSSAKVGPAYNDRLVYYVENLWDPIVASRYSDSLRKAIEAVNTFQPRLNRIDFLSQKNSPN